MVKKDTLDRWTCKRSEDLYGIREWSGGYFRVSDEGDVLVCPRGPRSNAVVNLHEVVNGLRERGITAPVLLRFGDILESRIELLNESFRKAIADAGYKGEYRGVYPVKVNQQQQVVAEIARIGKAYDYGLEVGSKAELIAAMAYMNDSDAYLVCNGYKDEEFIDLALYAGKMGMNVVLVVEMPGEVQSILDRAAAVGTRPRMGIRVKLSSRADGHWTDSGGDRSRFGLSVSQILDVVDTLKRNNQLDCLEMMHYHLGSQIHNIRNIRSGISEACRVYAGLVAEGAPMGLLNVGGGLAVDYDGSHTNFASSSNYSVPEYCSDIIEGVMSILDENEIPHPTLISESGRAVVAHHSVLVFNVLDASRFASGPRPELKPDEHHEMLYTLADVHDELNSKNVQEFFHDATYYRDEIRSMFSHGVVSLRDRALAEQIFWRIAIKVKELLQTQKYVPDEFEGLAKALSDVYYGNFSLFQSLPDSWAIDQLFPVMPIHRLNERPTREATIADITCDCDGRLDRFVDLHDVKHSLPLHDLKPNEEYYIGVFLVGAYQETLGDLHNLFGDTHIALIHVGDDGEMLLSHEVAGDSVENVLSYVEYDPNELVKLIKEKSERAVRRGALQPADRRSLVDAYQSGLRGYTYYEQ
jgi:arginine decarboxylase